MEKICTDLGNRIKIECGNIIEIEYLSYGCHDMEIKPGMPSIYYMQWRR